MLRRHDGRAGYPRRSQPHHPIDTAPAIGNDVRRSMAFHPWTPVPSMEHNLSNLQPLLWFCHSWVHAAGVTREEANGSVGSSRNISETIAEGSKWERSSARAWAQESADNTATLRSRHRLARHGPLRTTTGGDRPASRRERRSSTATCRARSNNDQSHRVACPSRGCPGFVQSFLAISLPASGS